MAKQENRNTLNTSVLVRRFLPYFRKYRKTMAFDLCCAALTTVCELVLPLIVRTITTRATYDVASLTVPFVLMMGGVYMLLRIIDAAANYYMQSIGHIMAASWKRICATTSSTTCRSCPSATTRTRKSGRSWRASRPTCLKSPSLRTTARRNF